MEDDPGRAAHPEGVLRILVAKDRIVAVGCPTILYRPVPRHAREAPRSAFAEAERLEFLRSLSGTISR